MSLSRSVPPTPHSVTLWRPAAIAAVRATSHGRFVSPTAAVRAVVMAPPSDLEKLLEWEDQYGTAHAALTGTLGDLWPELAINPAVTALGDQPDLVLLMETVEKVLRGILVPSTPGKGSSATTSTLSASAWASAWASASVSASASASASASGSTPGFGIARTRVGSSAHVAKAIRTNNARVQRTPPSTASRTSLATDKSKAPPPYSPYQHLKIVRHSDQSGRRCVICGGNHQSTTCKAQHMINGDALRALTTGDKLCFEFNGIRYVDNPCTRNVTCPGEAGHRCSLCFGNGDDRHKAMDCLRVVAKASFSSALSVLPAGSSSNVPIDMTTGGEDSATIDLTTEDDRSLATTSAAAETAATAPAVPAVPAANRGGFASGTGGERWVSNRAAKDRTRAGVQRLLYVDHFTALRKKGFALRPPEATYSNASARGFDFDSEVYKRLAARPRDAPSSVGLVETPTHHFYHDDVPANVAPRAGYVAYLTADTFLPQAPQPLRQRLTRVLRSVQDRVLSAEEIQVGLARQAADDLSVRGIVDQKLSQLSPAERSFPEFRIDLAGSVQKTEGATQISSIHIALHYPPACEHSDVHEVLNPRIDAASMIMSCGVKGPANSRSYRVSVQNTVPIFLKVDSGLGGGARFSGKKGALGRKLPSEVETSLKQVRVDELVRRVDMGMSQVAAHFGELNESLAKAAATRLADVNRRLESTDRPAKYVVTEWEWTGRTPRFWEAGIPCDDLVSVRKHVLDHPGVVFGPKDNIFSYSKAAKNAEQTQHSADVTIVFRFFGLVDSPGGILVAVLPHPSISRTQNANKDVYSRCAALDLGLTLIGGLSRGRFFGGIREPPLWPATNARWRTNFMSGDGDNFKPKLLGHLKGWEQKNNMLIPVDALPSVLRSQFESFTISPAPEGEYTGTEGKIVSYDPGDARGILLSHLGTRANFIRVAKARANPDMPYKPDTISTRRQFAGVQDARQAAQDARTEVYDRGDDYPATCSCGLARTANQYVKGTDCTVALVMQRQVPTAAHPETPPDGRKYCWIGIPLDHVLWSTAQCYDRSIAAAKFRNGKFYQRLSIIIDEVPDFDMLKGFVHAGAGEVIESETMEDWVEVAKGRYADNEAVKRLLK
ncbi:hypothetical protein JCM24511_01104 [Saitozyma sp. JCM 24511]|nr:hypothetical protein JCM24511_01104 [Saitozyma sp. JCM 24511]